MVREGFGSFMLQKFGWEDGKGLGKNEDGINRPISVAMQKDAKGIGFEMSQFEPWWDGLYNQTATKIGPKRSKSKSSKSDKQMKKVKKSEETKKPTADGKEKKGTKIKKGSIK